MPRSKGDRDATMILEELCVALCEVKRMAEEQKDEKVQETPVEAPEQQEKSQSVSDDEANAEDDSNFLVSTETYLKSGIHIGTKFKTQHMEPFIYKTRNDGLSVLNIQKIDERIQDTISLLGEYAPEDILIVCRRENGWKPVRILSKLTGIRSFPGRYPPGILTNAQLEDFTEAKILLAVDVWPDRNAIEDAIRVGIPVVGLCDTNNLCNNIDLVIPCNNKGRKSLGLIFYLLTRGYMLKRAMIKEESEMEMSLDDFMED
ncbi:MAG: 30S ribosomal protein S2 [Nanoarchaeota archaeon]